jgi:hypothetical protein
MRDRIRQPGTALVEEDHPGKGRQPPQKPGQIGLFPGKLDMRDEAGHEHQIDRAIAESLIGDTHLSALGITRNRHHISVQAATPSGPPAPPGRLPSQHPYQRRTAKVNHDAGGAATGQPECSSSTWHGAQPSSSSLPSAQSGSTAGFANVEAGSLTVPES